MAPNTTLKFAIWQSAKTQTEIAKRAEMQESTLSRIIHGHRRPSKDEKRRLAKALRTSIDQLFGEEAVTS